jgi:RNA polymerase sigma-70 factor (ECF subfamily)
MFEKALERILVTRKSPVLTADDFARMYEAHAKAVFNYCLFRVGDRATAEDLTAATFERVWRNRHRYDPEQANFTTWLFTIARHLIIDQQRCDSQRTFLALDEQQPGEKPSPENQIEKSEQLSRLQVLVQTLPDQERELIVLKFGIGMTNQQISEVLEKSETAVGSAIYRIMQKLRQEWEITDVEKTGS